MAGLSSSADNNQTKPNSIWITKSLQNATKQESTLTSSIPVQDTSNLVY